MALLTALPRQGPDPWAPEKAGTMANRLPGNENIISPSAHLSEA